MNNKIKIIKYIVMDYLVGATTILLLDSFYLNMVKQSWGSMILGIQGSKMELRMTAAIIVYMLMSFALYYFIILPRRSVYDAALLGLVIYGVFDMTNYALFKNFKLMPAIVDIVWGAILFAVSRFVVKTVFRR